MPAIFKLDRPFRRVMREFTINEISCVDRPAQEGALAHVIKRDDGNDAAEEQELHAALKSLEADAFARGALAALAEPSPPEGNMDKHEHNEPLSFGTFEEAVSYLVAKGSSRTGAMHKAAVEHPGLLATFQATSTARPTERVAKSKASQDFDLLVEGIRAKNPKMTRMAALQRARREHPTAFAAMQNA